MKDNCNTCRGMKRVYPPEAENMKSPLFGKDAPCPECCRVAWLEWKAKNVK